MAKLILPQEGRHIEIHLLATNTIGRHPKNRVRIPDSRVSATHALIYRERSGVFFIKDLNSSNGTFVNRRRIAGKTELEDGDEILVGGCLCRFSTDQTEAAARRVRWIDEPSENRIFSKSAPPQPDRFITESERHDIEALRADYEKLRITHELQRDIGLEFDVQRMLDKVLERIGTFLKYDRGVILLADTKGALTPQAIKSADPKAPLTLSSTLLQQIQTEKVGILSADALTDQRFSEAVSMIVQGVRSTMAVPLLYQEELLGVLVIDSLNKTSAYTEKDLHLLTNIANQAAQLIKNAQLAEQIEKEAAVRNQFQKLLSPDLAEMVVSGRLKVEKGGEKRVATVLFADIRGFTAMSEDMPAVDLLRLLNDYFEIVVEKVFAHEGTVDKFMGDGILVIWGAPVAHDDDPLRAVKAALDIQTALTRFNLTRSLKHRREIRIGIGINTGELVAGYIGSSQTMSYSVIGDAVNTAARICAAAAPGQILISENTYRHTRHAFRTTALPPITVKGKSNPLSVYSVQEFLLNP